MNIVAIGASAGGIEALKGLFTALPPKLDAAVFVRQATDTEFHIKKLRELVLDPRFFGHDEKT